MRIVDMRMAQERANVRTGVFCFSLTKRSSGLVILGVFTSIFLTLFKVLSREYFRCGSSLKLS